MKRRFSIHIGALLLAAIMLLTPLTAAFAAPVQPDGPLSLEDLLQQQEAPITRGEFAMLVNAIFGFYDDVEGENFLDVPDSHPYAADILMAKTIGYLAGDGRGYVFPDAVLSGAEAAVIINRLLGFDGSKVEQSGVAVPGWAVPSASVLLDLTMAEEALIAKKQLTVGDALEFVGALAVALMFQGSPYALTQADLRDDFYAYKNRQYLATATIPPGYPFAAAFVDTTAMAEAQQQEILSEILSGPGWAKGSDEWKISELYKMYLDNEARTESLGKVQPYFDEVRAVKTIDELIALAEKYVKYFNFQPFYGISLNKDSKVDVTKWCVIVMPSALDLGAKEYYAEDEMLAGVQAAYRGYLASLLGYMGEEDDLEARAEALYAIEKARADIMLPGEAYSDPYLYFTDTTWEEMLEITSVTQSLKFNADLYEITKDFAIYCPEVDYVEFIESLYTEENLQALKDIAMLNILTPLSMMLGDDLSDLSDDLIKALMGETGEKPGVEQRAQGFVAAMMQQTFSRLYAEKFSSEKIKSDVTDMIEDIRDKYRERIDSLPWMSADTKKAAVEKLDAIKALVAYPDEPIEAAPYDVKAKDDGGCLIDLFFSVADAGYTELVGMLKKPIEIDIWEHIPTFTVNAFYSATDNAIIIPAGVLQGVFYDPDAPREQNLGAIGAVIAHELTHAFDNTGAQFDKYGTLTDWWTEEDYKAFSELTDSMAEALSAIAFFGDIYINGALCTGEAVADLGAIACVLDIADDMPEGDLAVLMESWAAVWASRMSPEIVVYFLYMDPHPPNKTRVNFILSQFEEFYAVYGITEDDGMYIPAEARLSIW